jgi:hypothetical protein
MQDHDQKELPSKKRVGYLNPLLICEDFMKFTLDEKQKAHLNAIVDPQARAEALRVMRVEHDTNFAFYMGNAMWEFRKRQCIMAAYNFR